VLGATLLGARARLVRVETCFGRGLTQIVLSGQADAVAREARERLPAALAAQGLALPTGRILFNLVPAQIHKHGLPLDLALAAALLIGDGQWRRPSGPVLFLAELDLRGALSPPARATLLAALAAREEAEPPWVVTAPEAAREAALVPGLEVHACRDLGEVGALLALDEATRAGLAVAAADFADDEPRRGLRLDQVRDQSEARHALVLAALGGHPLWMEGPPGSGKSMLAARLPGLLPPLDEATALELARVEALLGPVPRLPRRPPVRAPHPSASRQAVLGGGRPLRPGELSRAHGGVLFLDELPEFPRAVLEGLRQPLEEGEVRVHRATDEARFPARVLLVAASNPCPCGWAGHPRIPCTCPPSRLERYRARVSGPLRDRFDLHVVLGPVDPRRMDGPPSRPSDEEVAARLEAARALQAHRRARGGFDRAGRADWDALLAAGVEGAARRLLRRSAERFGMSGRAILRTLRVARTQADWEGRARVAPEDVLTALGYRRPATEGAATTPSSPSASVPRPHARGAH